MRISIVIAACIAALAGCHAASPERVDLASPNGNVHVNVTIDRGQLAFGVQNRGRDVVERSAVALSLDGVDLAQDVALAHAPTQYEINQTFAWRGVHSQAVNHCRGIILGLLHAPGPNQQPFTMELRAFDDGVAFRFIIDGPEDQSRVPDERTTFALPPWSTVWSYDLTWHYEGRYVRRTIDQFTAGQWAAVPVVYKLPDDGGYAAITEAALVNYSGMSLEADGRGGFQIGLGHRQPISQQFRRYHRPTEADLSRIAEPAAIAGTITTPWRVVLIGDDLNMLMNSDVVASVCPPPDASLFPGGMATDWVRPGRAVWNYLDGGARTIEGVQEFIRMADKLGFEHIVLENYWRRFSDEQLRDLVAYARQRHVDIWVWNNMRSLRDPEARTAFFQRCHDLGFAGVKIDFFDYEHKDAIDVYQAMLRQCAQLKLMVDFHGANKPAGEARTWPNELTREAVSGMESYRDNPTKVQHDVTLPFTRFLVGSGDYTPVLFTRPGNLTSWPHEIATAAIFTSPLLTYAASPEHLLANPGVEMIRSIPSVWDQTLVLPPSQIGQIAVFARRSGKDWFLAILNGSPARSVRVPLTFLGDGQYDAMLIRDDMDNAQAERIEQRTAGRTDTLSIDLRPGGGFIGRFRRK